MKNHSYNLHAPICGIFCLHSVDVARYAALIQVKSITNCNAHLAESIFQTRSRVYFKYALEYCKIGQRNFCRLLYEITEKVFCRRKSKKREEQKVC
ncbi:hypothetical protein DXD91_14765 [Anaerobutyricum hallii]|uniref:Uncharacterized protein n=1 Tax=Anaerobutyricum hallii TaxID=39488 RepID=A0A374N3N2_9FIRM|nr:hypothetical protein DXD91_14765 [Anaerobutyricum hallii]